MNATALLHIESELAPGADASAFGSWCDHHHRELLAVPGFLRARRFEQLGPDGPRARLLTLYDLAAAAAVLDSDAYATHGRAHTPLPPDLAGALTFARSVWTALAPDDGTAAGEALVSVRSPFRDAADYPGPPAAKDAAAIVGIRRFAPVDAGADPAGSLTLVELRSADDLDAARRALPPTGAAAVERAYRQVFHAEA
jgi:hypothetical protein